jgi:uncharacterized protein (TIGR03437 family)
MRANASQLGIPSQAGVPSSQVTAFVSTTGEILPPTNNVLSVGAPYLGLLSEVSAPPAALQCDDTEKTVAIRVEEGFEAAFKTEGTPNTDAGNNIDESGYFAPGSNGGDGASGSTRFLLRFLNIPSGVAIKMPKHVGQPAGGPASHELDLVLVDGADMNGIGGKRVAGEGLVEADIDSGSGYAVYEVTAASASDIEALDIGVSVSWDGDAPPPVGVGQISVTYAPLSTELTASLQQPEPRFTETNPLETLFTVSACTPEPPPPPPPATVLTKLSGDNQSVVGGGPLQPLSVRVTQDGQPLAARPVVAAISGPGAPLVSCAANVATNANGVASIACFSKSTAADTSVVINVSDGTSQLAQPFLIAIQAGDVGLSLLSAARVRLPAKQTTADAVRVKASRQGTPAAGIPVYFWATPGITVPSAVTTSAGGIASASISLHCLSEDGRVEFGLTPGQIEGSVKVETLPSGFDSVTAAQGDAQSAPSGERLAQALVIEASDVCGKPVPGLNVTWNVEPANAATLEASHAATNQNGRASTLVRVGSYEGPFKVSAVVKGQRVEFNLEAEPGPSRIISESGDQQRVSKHETAPLPLVARVTGPDGSGYAGVRVNFRVVDGSGQLDPSSVLTDDDGRASAMFTAGSRLGAVRVEAYVDNKKTDFRLTVTGRKPRFDRSAVVDGAGFGIGLTPGGCGSIFGSNLMEDINGVMVPTPNMSAALSADGKTQSAGLWPVEFEGVSVRINGAPAPLFALASVDGSEQINFQVPFDLGTVSQAVVEINNNGTITTVDQIPILAAKPRLFEIPIADKIYAAALHLDYTLVGPDAPARPGEIILLYLTGLGPTDPAVSTNLPGPVPAATTVYQPVVRLDGADQEVLGSYYAPQLTSVYQVNLRVGENTAPGEREIEVLIEGVGGQKLLLPVGAQ